MAPSRHRTVLPHAVSSTSWARAVSNLAIFELSWDRDKLRGRIKERTRAMFEQGLLNEARELFARYPQRPKPLNSVGLRECGEFL